MDADDAAAASGQRPRKKRATATRKSLTCEHCNRPFARLEHLQRHLRTHTKEKPFTCEICSKSFARSDLLVRHERLVHPAEAAARADRRAAGAAAASAVSTSVTSTATATPVPAATVAAVPVSVPVPGTAATGPGPGTGTGTGTADHLNPSWGYDLNLLSHAASHVALEGQGHGHGHGHGQPQLQVHGQGQLQVQQQQHDRKVAPVYERPISENYGVEPSILDLADLGDPVQDFTTFLESVGLSSDWDSGLFNSVEPEPLLPTPIPALDGSTKQQSFGTAPRFTQELDSRNIAQLAQTTTTPTGPAPAAADEAPSFSNFGSRLPSLQPEAQDSDAGTSEHNSQPRPAWDISTQEHQLFTARLEDFAHVLPKNFVRPSRHALSRYMAGYISGLNEHLPFIHVPTLSVARCPPELTLALAAAGSHYRFENSRGIELFHAAKAILLERLRRRDSRRTTTTLPPNPQWAPNSTPRASSSVVSNPSNSPFPQQQFIPFMDNTSLPGEDAEGQMEIIRTFLLLTIFASWESHPDILRDMLALQSTLARLVRDHGLKESPATTTPPESLSWPDWSRLEADRRTKLVVYCFFNLHSIMYNIPPLILNSELNLNMPCSADEWKANTASQWRRVRRPSSDTNTTPTPSSFQDALANLFTKSAAAAAATTTPPPSNPVSPLGNYVLIHAIIQQIFFARQLCLSAPSMAGTSLRPDDLAVMGNSLSAWKRGWRQTPESSIDPQNPAGPIAFTSTALLGLAYIRLHLDLGPCRRLVTQDPVQIAHALNDSPPLTRSSRLIMALLHSAHALSIPVRLGIDFVARTHSFFWSIQHSICSLECAFLLSRWLLSIPATQHDQGLSDHERKLLLWVKGMIDETDMSSSVSAATEAELITDPALMRRLSVAVVRVWSRTFKGNTNWPIVDLIGASLEIYADLLDI